MNVQWHEGMLLSPHHFQQMSNHIRKLFRLAAPFNYGFFDFKMDTSALASGVIRLLQANGIFQDGLYFDFDALKDPPVEKNLSEFFQVNTSAVKIHLAVRAYKMGENSVTGSNSRYYSEEIVNVTDENSGENPINIPIVKPKLRLLLEDELDARYISFPIVEVQKSVDGAIQMTNFLPPFITVNEYCKIVEMCRDISHRIREKVSYFSDRKNNFSQESTDVALSNLRLLIKALLPMEAMIHINNIRPFDLYKCVVQTAADVIATNPSQLIPRLPPYQHEDLYNTFYNLLEHVSKVLDTLKQKYTVVHFEKEGPLFKLKMQKEWLEKGQITIGIQKAFSSSDSDVLNWISSAQIASESMLQLIKDRRIVGAERQVEERGAYITQPNGMTLVSVKNNQSYIKPAEKLCIVNYSYPIVPDSVVIYAEC